MSKLRRISEAIGRIEGFYRQGKTLPKRLNNPGDLLFKQQAFAKPYSITLQINGKPVLHIFAQFDTVEHGWEACDRQVLLYAGRIDPLTTRPYTVSGVVHKWAPEDDGNDPKSYTAQLCQQLGCRPEDVLREVLKDDENGTSKPVS